MNEALAEILAEIDRFLGGGVSEEELVWAKKFLTGSLPLTLETNDQLAQRLLEPDLALITTPGEWLADPVEGMKENPGRNFIRLALVPPLERIEEAAERLRRVRIA